jgi:MscS family membrane protein
MVSGLYLVFSPHGHDTLNGAVLGGGAPATSIRQSQTHRPRLLSRQLVPAVGLRAGLLGLCFLAFVPAWAQFNSASSVPATAPAEAPRDSFGRTTPKGTVLGFLLAARNGQQELAIQYLNTRKHGEVAFELAQQLFTVLDRRLPPKLPLLSDKPEGSLSGRLRHNENLVGTIRRDSGDVDIVLERVEREPSGPLWLFSSKTPEAIPDLYAETNFASVNDVLPKFLVETRIASVPLYQWLALTVGMPLVYYVATLLNRLLGLLIGMMRRRLYSRPDLPNPEVLSKPIRLLLLAFVIDWTISRVSLPLFARQFWSSTATVITIAASVWLLMRVNRRIERYTRRFLSRNDITGITATMGLVRVATNILTICVGALAILYSLGLNPIALLIWFGIGGVAVALVAQKTLENVIGGGSIIVDRVVNLGDTIKLGEILATVEAISLRSTRIRTLDRTLVSIPNGLMASMTLENFSTRDKFWFHPILALRYGATAAQIRAVVDRVRSLLVSSPEVEPDSVRVNVLRLARASLDVEVYAYVLARDWQRFIENHANPGLQARFQTGKGAPPRRAARS